MSSNPSKPDQSQQDGAALPVNDHETPPGDVPVFNCVIYVAPDAAGGVRARVANLAGLECAAASERQALSQLVPAFKQRVGALVSSGSPIPWIDPPQPIESGEQQRLIPIHL